MTEINYGYGYNSTNSIAIIWSIDDVRHVIENYGIDVDLTDEECMEVLDYCLDNHDAQYGMSWENIDNAIDYLFIEESEIKREGIVE